MSPLRHPARQPSSERPLAQVTELRPALNRRRAGTVGGVVDLTSDGGRSDAALVVAVARRDESALAELYERHGGAVHGLARRITRDDALAQDITQTVFVRLWRQPERFDAERASLRTYLMADTHGRSVDLIRSEEARRRREDDVSAEPSVIPTVESQAWASLDATAVRDAVSQLPEHERAAIVLAYFDGHSYRDVAEVLGEPEGTVKSRIRSGLRRLRGLVEVAGVTP